MKWKTKISDANDEGTSVRGKALEDLVGKISYADMVFLLLAGKMPTPEESKMMEALLVCVAEHSIAVPSITSARIAASGSGSFVQGVAAGILAIGEHHGGAGEGCARVLQENLGKPAAEIVVNFSARKERLPGFGHKVYTTDPRTKKLFSIAKELGIFGSYCNFALELEKELERAGGKKLCLNVDGAIAAIISEMGFHWKSGRAFFVIPRTAGISAHVIEELMEEKPFSKRLEDGEYEYTGEKSK